MSNYAHFFISKLKKPTTISKVFTGFLIASTLMWLLINLSKIYTTTLVYSVSYTQLPQDKIFEKKPINEVNVNVQGNGFNLLVANFSDREIEFPVDKLQRINKNKYFLLPNKFLRQVNSTLKTNLEIIQILKDTLDFKITKLESKKIALIPNVTVDYKVGYNIAKKINISPDSIFISGSKTDLSQIKSLMLEKLKFTDVSEDISEKADIQIPEKFKKIRLSEKSATISILVDKFTEGELEIPVKVENITKESNINIFPKKVKVIFKVGLKNFNNIKPELFEVVADYKETKANELNYLIPKIIKKPNGVSSVRITPEKIDFLIRN